MTSAEFVELLRREDEIRVIDDEVDICLEAAHIAYVEMKKKSGGKAILFNHLVCKTSGVKYSLPVLINIFGSAKRTKLVFGAEPDAIANEIQSLLHLSPPNGLMDKLSLFGKLFSLKSVFPKRTQGRAPCNEIVYEGAQIDLMRIMPVLTTWELDGGPFITMGQVFTKSLDGKMHNLGMYRLQVYGPKRLGLHWQIHKDSNHFYHEYKKAGAPMPVAIAVGGDPLFTWCATAPLPLGVFEPLLYGFIRKKAAKLVKCQSVPLDVPEGADFVIEGFVDMKEEVMEGPFGDHTGYYTPVEPYPALDVTCVTSKKEPIFYATVVGKPPIEDKYMGWATERIFLPLLRTQNPALVDYHLPENGCFHNLVLAKIKPQYPGHSLQIMHNFWGAGQMSFVKHAIFVDESAPKLTEYEALAKYITDRLDEKRLLKSFGIADALDHSGESYGLGGKLGIDATGEPCGAGVVEPLGDAELLERLKSADGCAVGVKQYLTQSRNPVTVISVEKKQSLKHLFTALVSLKQHLRIVAAVDCDSTDIANPYMLIWRVSNNFDAARDLFMQDGLICLDATAKDERDGFAREWPKDVECSLAVLSELKNKKLLEFDTELLKKYEIANI